MEDVLTNKDYAELSSLIQSKVRGLSWWQLHGYESLMLFFRFVLFFAGFTLFASGHWIGLVLGMVVMSYAYTGIAITGTHETSHLSYVKGKWANKAWAFFFSDFWAAQSHIWWHYRHVQVHHIYPNIPDREPKPFYYPWINRYVYFFLIPYFVELWMIVHSIKHLWRRPAQLAAYLVFMIAGFALHSALFASLGYSWLASFALTMLMRSLFAPLFMHLAVFNHIGLDNPQQVLPWMPRQDNTTRNIKPHWLLNGMGGNAFLDCHLEHHLFPSLSNHMLQRIRPVVREFMKAKGYAYREETYLSCLRNCIKHYHQLFQNLPKAIW